MLIISEMIGGERHDVVMMKYLDQIGFDEKKILEIWIEYSKHDVLFTDFTSGNIEVLIDILMDPRAVWFEVLKLGRPVGIFYLTKIIPNYDGYGHFAFWDKKGRGREVLALNTLSWLIREFNLRRISAEIPVYQAGAIRWIRRVGFKEEGEKREAILHKGSWLPMKLFGILASEVAYGQHIVGERDQRDAAGDEGRNQGSVAAVSSDGLRLRERRPDDWKDGDGELDVRPGDVSESGRIATS